MVSCQQKLDNNKPVSTSDTIETVLFNEKQLFSSVKDSAINNADYSFSYLNDSIKFFDRTGYKFCFRDKHVEDSFTGYWGIATDTLYFWSETNYKNNCKSIFPFAVFTQDREEYYRRENECYEFERIAMGGNSMHVIFPKQNTTSGEIRIKHILTGNESHSRSYFRAYHISFTKGIIAYKTDYNPDSTIINFPY